ncbi:hypothetical protein [Parafrankia sp. CH37]|uniref:hypothetical protein n=1 Tax=Parafrankia sp. CH37 TaxID=683308 RepID=UPI001D004AAF|nr:hypothetical protein [Parafrankia sp. CH37]
MPVFVRVKVVDLLTSGGRLPRWAGRRLPGAVRCGEEAPRGGVRRRDAGYVPREAEPTK